MCVVLVGGLAGNASAQVRASASAPAPVVSTAASAPQAATAAEQFTVTVKGGATRSSVFGKAFDEDDKEDLSARFGYALGASLAIRVNDSVSIQPEALLTTKGYRVALDATHTGNVDLTYLEIPVLLKWAATSEKTRPFLYGGGGLALRLTASESANDITRDLESETAGTDAFFVLGGGVQQGAVSVEARLSRSLKTAAATIGTSKPADIRNSALMLLVGYSFGSR